MKDESRASLSLSYNNFTESNIYIRLAQTDKITRTSREIIWEEKNYKLRDASEISLWLGNRISDEDTVTRAQVESEL